MALIKCPECGKEISDKAKICVGCGFPIKEYLEETVEPIACPYCGADNHPEADYCIECDMRLSDYVKDEDRANNKPQSYQVPDSLFLRNPKTPSYNPNFKGIYKYTLFGEKREVYCPRCGSEDCSHYQEQRVIPGKKKTRYTANLNPLHPFTLINKKEKVVRGEQVVTESKFICNSCGKIFY